jgi:hypothetical protein
MPWPFEAFRTTSTRPKKMYHEDSIVGAFVSAWMMNSAPSAPNFRLVPSSSVNWFDAPWV